MLDKSRVLFGLVALVTMASVPAALAQGWQQQNQINQDASLGLINPNQAANLNAQESQIRSQEQFLMQRQGGQLTPQQQQVIRGEQHNVERGLRHDRYRDGTMPANAYGQNAMVPQQLAFPQYGVPQMPNGMLPVQNGVLMPNNGVVPVNATGYPQGYNANANPQGNHHHHGFIQGLEGLMNGGNGQAMPMQQGFPQQGFPQQGFPQQGQGFPH